MPQNIDLLQISATLDSRIGGPVHVIKQSAGLLDTIFNHKLIIIGNSNDYQGNHKSLPAFLNNRFGLPYPSRIHVLKREIDNSEALLLHGFFLFSTMIACVFSKSQNIYLMPHGSLEMYGKHKSFFRKTLFKSLLSFSTNLDEIHFITASQSEADQIAIQYPKNLVTVVGIGINQNLKAIREPRKEISNTLRLLTISRIDDVKRVDLLIHAVSEIRKSGMTVALTVIGSGNAKLVSKLKTLASDLNLEDCISFLGFIGNDTKYDFIDEADIFVLASDNENFGISVAESISRGIPVVISENVGIASFVTKHGAGIVTETNKPAELCNAIVQIVKDYSKFEQNTRVASSLLGWEKVLQNWITVLRNPRNDSNC